VRLLAEIRAAGSTGGYSQLKALVRQLRPASAPQPVVRFETPAASRRRSTSRGSPFRGASGTRCWWCSATHGCCGVGSIFGASSRALSGDRDPSSSGCRPGDPRPCGHDTDGGFVRLPDSGGVNAEAQNSRRGVGAGLNTNVSISSLRAPVESSTAIRTGNSPVRVTVPCQSAVPATGSTL
jgi:hypothetical protein